MSSTTHLPVEILSMIVDHCDISTYFALTRINTALRQLVYQKLEPILADKRNFYSSGTLYYSDDEPPEFPEIPHDLAIHMLNNQALDSNNRQAVIERNRDTSPTNIYAPFFTVADYNADLARNISDSTHTGHILAGMMPWLIMLGSSGNNGIDAIRMVKELERRMKRKREDVLLSKKARV